MSAHDGTSVPQHDGAPVPQHDGPALPPDGGAGAPPYTPPTTASAPLPDAAAWAPRARHRAPADGTPPPGLAPRVGVRDVVVAGLAGLGAAWAVGVLVSPVHASLARSGAYGAITVVEAVVTLVGAVLAAVVALVVRATWAGRPSTAGAGEDLLVGVPPVLVLGAASVLGSAAWGDLVATLALLGWQVLTVAVGIGAALATGAVLRSRAATRTPQGSPQGAH